MGRIWRLLVTAVVLGALLSPVVRDHDSFPLATYPMYSSARGRAVTFPTAVGVDEQGPVRRLSPRVIGGTGDALIVSSELRNAIAARRVAPLCDTIARRADDADLVAIEVVTERHDTVSQVQGRPSLIERTVHGRCEVPR